MSLPVFPFTDVKPPFNYNSEDAVLRSSMEDGTIILRNKFTQSLGIFGGITFELSSEENDEVIYFYNSTIGRGSLPFVLNLWINDKIISYPKVILSAPPQHRYVGMGCWDVEINVISIPVAEESY